MSGGPSDTSSSVTGESVTGESVIDIRDPELRENALVQKARRQKVLRVDGLTYEFLPSLEPDQVDLWHGLYEEAFAKAATTSPERQTLDEQEFRTALTDHEVRKVGVSDDAGTQVGLTIYSPISRPDLYPWLSQPYFEARYGQQYRDGRVKYFVATLVAAGAAPDGLMGSMGQMITDDLLTDGEVTVIFDCADHNAWLPQVLHGLAAATAENMGAHISDLDRIGVQEFYAFDLATSQ